MIKNEDNEKTKYEEKNNDFIMEYEEDNVIEYLESEKKKALNSLDSAINNKSSYMFKEVIALCWLIPIIISLCAKFFSFSAIYGCAFIIASIFNTIYIKKFNNNIKGYKSQLKFLEEKLKEEKEKEMSNEKNKEKEMIIENSEKSEGKLEKRIDEINRQSCLYYDMGTHEKRLAKYYKLGMLKYYLNKISERYNENDINLIEKYLKEKGQEKIKGNK